MKRAHESVNIGVRRLGEWSRACCGILPPARSWATPTSTKTALFSLYIYSSIYRRVDCSYKETHKRRFAAHPLLVLYACLCHNPPLINHRFMREHVKKWILSMDC